MRILRVVLGTLAGLFVAFSLVVLVELFSAIVYPTPPGFAGTQEEVCQHVEGYPDWVLAVEVVAWSATTLVSTGLATKLGGTLAGAAVGLLLLAAVTLNLSMLPYTLWFKLAALVWFPIACFSGIRVSTRRFKTNDDIAPG